MTSLLQKFRISFSEVIEVAGINDKPSRERWASFGTSHHNIVAILLTKVWQYNIRAMILKIELHNRT